MNAGVEIGIDSFAVAHDDSRRALSATQRLRNPIEEIELADQVRLMSSGSETIIGRIPWTPFLPSSSVPRQFARSASVSPVR